MLFIEEGKDYEDIDTKQLPYEHVQNLGFGHSGNVEEVRDRNTNKVFARKTIRIPVSNIKKAESTSVFHNEVKIIRGLGRHRHIVSVFATYATTQVFGILLQPAASDGDLEHFLAEYWDLARKPQTEKSSAHTRMLAMSSILKQGFGCLASGLSFMHEKNIRHKDVKPNNILVHDGVLIYTDFGYSFDSNGFTHSTTEGRPDFLTRRYCAPEVRDYDKRNSKSDVWSLGCVFIDMFSAITLVLTVDSEKCFSEIMERLHEQLSSIQYTDSFGFLREIIVHMTQLDCRKRICSAHTTSRIIQTKGFCCLDCSQASLTTWKTYPTQEECDNTCIENRRNLRKKHNSFGVLAGAENEDRLRADNEVFNNTYSQDSSRKSVEKGLLDEVHPPLENGNDIAITPRTGERESNAESDISHPETTKPLHLDEHTGKILGLDTLCLDQDQKQASGASPKLLVEVNDSTSHDDLTSSSQGTNNANSTQWIWSEQHKQYYFCTHDGNGHVMYNWQNNPQYNPVLGSTSNTETEHKYGVEHVPGNVRSTFPESISGTPGFAESLDSVYRRRSGAEVRRFFTLGRVFAMLYTEAGTGDAALRNQRDDISATKYGEIVYSSIRRFVVVEVRQGFVYACGVSTYSDRGALKPGCIPSEHAVVYFSGTNPTSCYLRGEQERGMVKDPIEVEPADDSLTMKRTSRIRFSKTIPVETNVKVKDIGVVIPAHRIKLISYWRSEFDGS